MLHRLLLLIALFLSSCSSHTDEPATPASEERFGTPGTTLAEEEVVAFLTSYYSALSDRDWPLFEAHFLPDGRLVAIWTPPDSSEASTMDVTAAEFVAAAPQGPDSREIFEERMTSWEIDVRGSIATAWVAYEARFGDPGDIMEWEGLDAFSLLETAEGWKIISLAYAAEED
jgi:hypothetical protein